MRRRPFTGKSKIDIMLGYFSVDGEDTDWKATAEIIRENVRPPVIAPGHGKAPENVIDVR